jgi:hypothetical protein
MSTFETSQKLMQPHSKENAAAEKMMILAYWVPRGPPEPKLAVASLL